jgi:hypothetical protein
MENWLIIAGKGLKDIKQDRNLLNQLISFINSTFEELKIIYWFSINLLTGMQKHTK